MALFEPIEMLWELSRNDAHQAKVGFATLEWDAPSDKMIMSKEFWEVLARQAHSYRNFYIKAYTLRELTNMRAAGRYVSDRAMQRAMDEFTQAIRICQEFNPIVQVAEFNTGKKDQ